MGQEKNKHRQTSLLDPWRPDLETTEVHGERTTRVFLFYYETPGRLKLPNKLRDIQSFGRERPLFSVGTHLGVLTI